MHAILQRFQFHLLHWLDLLQRLREFPWIMEQIVLGSLIIGQTCQTRCYVPVVSLKEVFGRAIVSLWDLMTIYLRQGSSKTSEITPYRSGLKLYLLSLKYVEAFDGACLECRRGGACTVVTIQLFLLSQASPASKYLWSNKYSLNPEPETEMCTSLLVNIPDVCLFYRTQRCVAETAVSPI